jgi:hypothetical protein
MGNRSSGTDIARGIVVGLCATTALDWLSMLLYEKEDAETRAAEERARGGRHAYEVAVARLSERAGVRLSDEAITTWGWRFHKAFGLAGGVGYLLLRRLFPRLRWGRGLAFGMAFFLVVDEILVPALALTPGPRAFPWKVHARGAAAHVAYGIAAESSARLLGSR